MSTEPCGVCPHPAHVGWCPGRSHGDPCSHFTPRDEAVATALPPCGHEAEIERLRAALEVLGLGA